MPPQPLFNTFRQHLQDLLFDTNRVTSFVIACGQHPARFEEATSAERVYHVLRSAVAEGWLDDLVAVVLDKYPKSQLGRWLVDKPQIVPQMQAEMASRGHEPPPATTGGPTVGTVTTHRDAYVATQQTIHQYYGPPADQPILDKPTPQAPSPSPHSEAERLARMLANPRVPVHERLAAGEELGQLGDRRFGVTTLELDVVEFAGGSFVIGEPPDQAEYDDNYNTQAVQVDHFWLSRYLLTNAQYAHFLAAQGGQYDPQAKWWQDADGSARAWLEKVKKHKPSYWEDHQYGIARPNAPVVGVTWYEARAFCRWLTAELRDGYRYCLPSELEWEYAARGAERRIYPWGMAKPSIERANFEELNYNHTSAVGCFPAGATPEGLLDMMGNVWVWTRSVFASYPYDPADGRESELVVAQKRFITRGGPWLGHSILLRASDRSYNSPDFFDLYVGFRLARHPL